MLTANKKGTRKKGKQIAQSNHLSWHDATTSPIEGLYPEDYILTCAWPTYGTGQEFTPTVHIDTYTHTFTVLLSVRPPFFCTTIREPT